MQTFILLFQRHPLVFFHLLTAFAALLVGIYLLTRKPRGDGNHRLWGWTWVLLMGTTAVLTVFIRDYAMPNIWGYTPIHIFTVVVFIFLPPAVLAARRHQVRAHSKAMKGMFIGACVVAGLFTLLPGRFLGNLLWKQWLGVMV